MNYKVFVFSTEFFYGKKRFDFDLFNQICNKHLIDIDQIVVSRYDNYSFEVENENLIIFCDNKNLNDFIFANISNIGIQKEIINNKIAIFNKNGKMIIFAPIEIDLKMFEQVLINKNRKLCQFHIYGLKEDEIIEKMGTLKDTINDLQYKIFTENLLSHLYVSYNGIENSIDSVQVKIASLFSQSIYSENEFSLAEIVYRLLKLKDYKISIWESGTKGIIIQDLLKTNSLFEDVLKETSFEKTDCYNADDLFEKAQKFHNFSKSEVSLFVHNKRENETFILLFAICYGKEIYLFKNSFKADFKSSLSMIKNSVLFNLSKKLRQNDISFR